jgi:hypothetical protein
VKKLLHTLFAGVFLIGCDLYATDLVGAETVKRPASVEILLSGAAKPDEPKIGNVWVTYTDGATDPWTTKGNCSLARLAVDGTVGWTTNEPETKVNASYSMRPNNTLVLCRKGKVIAKVRSALPFIEEWKFTVDGRQLVLVTRASHGPADIELHEVDSGRLIETVKAYGENLPLWAQPFKE